MRPSTAFLRLQLQHLPAAAASLLAALILAAAPPVQAGEDSLAKIARTGHVSLGTRDNLVPASYLDDKREVVGYHIDICRRIVQALQQRYDVPRLLVVLVPTTSATRFAMLNNGTVDIDCGMNPIAGSSSETYLLSHAVSVQEIRIMTTAGNQLAGFADLDGRIVASTPGLPMWALVRSAARKSGLIVKEAYGRDVAESFGLLESGRADAVAGYAPYLTAQRNRTANPERYVFLEGTLRTDAAALMVRAGDAALLSFINEVLAAMMRSGEMARLYEKWFVELAPGQRLPLNLPLPTALRELFANPGGGPPVF